MFKFTKYLTTIALLFQFNALAAEAAHYTNGSGDFQWSTEGNWDPRGVPNDHSDVLIDQSLAYVNKGDNFAQDISINADTGNEGLWVLNNARLFSRNTYIGLQNGGPSSFAELSSGGKWYNSGYFIVGYQGVNRSTGTWTLNIHDALLSVFGIAIVGDYPNVKGNLRVNGQSGLLTTSQELRVGNAGIGQLDVSQGAWVDSDGMSSIGYHAGSEGTVTVNGRGSLWENTQLFVGFGGHGTLSLSNGAIVTSQSSIIIGDKSTAHGFITVGGPRTSLETKSSFRVGESGHGELSVVDGGRALNYGDGFLGVQRGGVGDVFVSGTGSTWVNVGDVIVGDVGVGFLTVRQAGKVISHDGFIGLNEDAEGYVRVEDEGSIWSGSGRLVVGGTDTGAAGTLTLASGGAVRFPEVVIQPGGTIEGQGTIFVAPGGLAQNGGELKPEVNVVERTFAPSAKLITNALNPQADLEGPSPSLLIDGDYSQTQTGRLVLGIASPTSYATLDVTGHASLDGTLKLEFLNGFVPHAGQSFNLLHLGSMSGQFTAFDLPTLGGGLKWDTHNLYSDGALAIAVPEPASWVLLAIGMVAIQRTVNGRISPTGA